MVYLVKESKCYFLKKKKKLPDNSPNIFEKSNIDCYMERPSSTFCNGKYSVLKDLCYAEFLAYYTLGKKSVGTCEYQPDEFDNNLIEIPMKNVLTPKI